VCGEGRGGEEEEREEKREGRGREGEEDKEKKKERFILFCPFHFRESVLEVKESQDWGNLQVSPLSGI